MIDTNPILTMTDLRAAFCSDGIADRLVRMGVDLDRFEREGIRASELLGRGQDAHVARAVRVKQQKVV